MFFNKEPATRRSSCLVIICTLLCGACGGSDGDRFDSFSDSQAVIDDFADDVVVATYAQLAIRLTTLGDAARTLVADPTQANLTAAQQAWLDARVPWEASEGFLFGPADSLGIDPAMDSWPVDLGALDAVLAGNAELTLDYVGNLDPTLQGFHAIEYMLFGADGLRDADDLSPREAAYVAAVMQLMERDSADLEEAWDGGDGAYADVFKGAGNGSTVYPSRAAAAEEIVRGMIGITDELANSKLAEPYDQGDVALIESHFSGSSLADFTSNLRGLDYAYTGDVDIAQTAGTGIDSYVRAVDPDLDARITAQIDAARAAVGAIPSPFRDAITDPAAAPSIEAAQAAIRTLQTTLEQELLPLLQ